MDRDKNIFEAASKKLGKKKKAALKQVKKNPPFPVKSGRPGAQGPKLNLRPPMDPKNFRDPEIEAIREKIHQMQREIVQKLDYINQHTHLTPQQLSYVLSDPKNYTPAQWEELQSFRKKWGDKIINAVGREVDMNHLFPPNELNLPESPKIKATTDASRKGKTLGARKKWIPMR